MTDQPPKPVEAARYVSEEQVRARALAEVLRDQEQRADAVLQAEARKRRVDRVRRGSLIVTWCFVAYIWLGAPSWLRVEQPPLPPVAAEVQSLRLNVFLQTQAIEAYRERHGRLPWVLQEAGPPFRGMEYRRFDSRTYELQGRSPRVILHYHSDQPPLDFVQDAGTLLLVADERGAAEAGLLVDTGEGSKP